MLLRAFAQVRRERDAHLLILGEGSERANLEAMIADLDLERDVLLPGWVSNPYPFMVAAQAFVLSSRWEGLPSVLIEALYCGVPVIATDCPSGPTEILDGGRHGSLVPVGDVDALSREIVSALDGRVPRPTAASWLPFEQDAVVGRYLDVLEGRSR
jgi:glycosyltransferase involved in cell wall biosynthesis